MRDRKSSFSSILLNNEATATFIPLIFPLAKKMMENKFKIKASTDDSSWHFNTKHILNATGDKPSSPVVAKYKL